MDVDHGRAAGGAAGVVLRVRGVAGGQMARDVTLAVLAGGEGSRMGRPKGLLEIEGQSILAYLLDRWRWDGPTLLVTAPGREHPPAWQRFEREVVDSVAGEGPLRGIATALSATTTELLIATTCDMPGIAREQLDWLVIAAQARPEAIGVMLRRRGADVEPFPCAFRPPAAAAIEQQLATKRRAVHRLLDISGFAAVNAPPGWPDAVWTNLNEPGDLDGL
jgi:molybdopterin-guanine dinucleotide biosynthesis protein A